MLPKPIPALNAKQWEALQQETKRPATDADEERYQRATKTFKDIPL